jgi:hypothetical protein
MVTIKRDLLFIGVEAATFDRYRESLSLAEFRADFISTVSGALELMVLLPYDALIVAYPTPDLPLERFLDAVRRENSSCRHAAVVLLAAPGWGSRPRASSALAPTAGCPTTPPRTAPADPARPPQRAPRIRCAC